MVRKLVDSSREPPSRGPVHGRPPAGMAHGLLTLQSQAGNRAVGRALAGPPVAQRFVGTEHKALGDSTGRLVDLGNGVVVSFGDLVALSGDEYKSIDDLMADTRTAEGRARLLAAFRDDHIPDPAHTRLPEPSDAQKADRFLTFLRLAAENPLHFNNGGQAVEKWSSDHAAALTTALDAGLQKDPAQYQLALAREAFGQHYLTDAFSGGHLRTPRADIIGWFRAHFGPAVVDTFISRLSNRVIDGLVAQISPQTNWPDAIVRREVRADVGQRIAQAIAAHGGRAQINDFFALGVAGVVSGAMHDLEGRRGVAVSSEAHPAAWVAYGDAQLADSPVSRQQAQLAIAAALAHVDRAHEIGQRHSQVAGAAEAPTITYFGFDSASLNPTATTALAAVARRLHAQPQTQVTLTGHTDPSGPDAYNEELGMRRAQAAAATLIAAGARSDQVLTQSQGERAPVSVAPGQLRLNRRVTFEFAERPGPYRDVGRDEATEEVQAVIPPPYVDVRRYVPRPLPAGTTTPAEGGAGPAHVQVELENCRWGSIPPTLRAEVNRWVRGYGPMLTARLASEPTLDDTTVKGYAIQPRPLVDAIVRDLLGDAAAFLEQATGQQMSP